MTRKESEFLLTLVSMLCILAYNFKHTADLLAGWVNPYQLGFVAALGIELTVVRLSFSIGSQTELNRRVFYYCVLAFALIVSIVANISEGFHVKVGSELTTETYGQLDLIQLTLAIGANLLLSLTVASLAEILGSEYEVTMPGLNRLIPALPRLEKPVNTDERPGNNVNGRYDDSLKPEPGESRAGHVKRFVFAKCKDLPRSVIIKALCDIHNVSHTTIRRDIDGLIKAGLLTVREDGQEAWFEVTQSVNA